MMKALLRIVALAATLACGFTAPATAQEASSTVPAAEKVIGPPQLHDFTLNGTVTRRAEPAGESSESAPPRQQSSAGAPAPAQQAQTLQPRRGSAERGPEPEEQRQALSGRDDRSPASAAAVTARPAAQPDLRLTPAPAAGFAPLSAPVAEPAPFAPVADEAGGFPLLPWLIAIALLGGAAVYFLRRPRSRYALAGGPELSKFVAPEPSSQPRPPAAPPPAAGPPAPRVAPPPTAPAGIVSTRLRPWLDFEFRPDRAIIDAETAVVEFELIVLNSGSGPARDVQIQAALFNAGPQQDQTIGAFFAAPLANGNPVPVIPPLKRVAFRSAVRMRRDQLQEFELGGRRLFVPVIGLNARYRWGGGEGQSATSYLVGREGRGDKLAPLRVAAAPREMAGIRARELEQRIRS